MSGATAPDDDPYDTGRAWQVDPFAARWAVDPADLRRALNLCAFSLRLTIGNASAGQRKRELDRIAETGEAFARALAGAGDTTAYYLLAGRVPRELRSDITINPGRYRQMAVEPVRELASRARWLAGQLKVTRKPTSLAATPEERIVVDTFAHLRFRSHGDWPNVTLHKAGERANSRVANEAGRFVIAGAEEFFGIRLSDQRLRTALGTIQKPPAKT